MSPVDDYYPIECAFCKISAAYQPSSSSPVPISPDPDLVSPQCHLILSTPLVLAFLDIMPIARGHILITTRKHYTKLSDLQPSSKHGDWLSKQSANEVRATSRALGEWMPVVSRALCKVTGIEDWNVVQNNGERAAQVVPHIHFHLIPRYQEGRLEGQRTARKDHGMLKSWKVFGRGSREDLDDEEGAELAGLLRAAIKEEVEEQNSAEKDKPKL
ncbi:hit domain-containing protein [Zymoseptoria brevis]|uniref:Hit domain-containing protein n=1 Tax=Zymoseptoria brevis TaxID=1047168 RepID=A0A0F4GA47_9PEZI|nr:hit domain-containing protein [Zymoseptoria brevis]